MTQDRSRTSENGLGRTPAPEQQPAFDEAANTEHRQEPDYDYDSEGAIQPGRAGRHDAQPTPLRGPTRFGNARL